MRPHNFVPAQLLYKAVGQMDLRNWAALRQPPAAEEFAALIFWFVLDQAKTNIEIINE